MRILLALLLVALVHAEEDEIPLPKVSTAEEIASLTIPEALLNGKVSVISGGLYLSQTDLVAEGAEPVVLTRYYATPGIPERYSKYDGRHLIESFKRSPAMGGWRLFGHCSLFRTKKGVYQVAEPSGLTLEYRIDKKGNTKLVTSSVGMHNLGPDGPSGRYDPRNLRIEVGDNILIHTPIGYQREYRLALEQSRTRFYQLVRERLPNGRILRYHYKFPWDRNPTRIESMDPQERVVYATIDLTPDGASADGLEVAYRTDRRWLSGEWKDKTGRYSVNMYSNSLLEGVVSPFYSKEEIRYDENFLLESYCGENEVFSCVNEPAEGRYRVARMEDSDPFSVRYTSGLTTVKFADKTYTHYRLSPDLLITRIDRCDSTGRIRHWKEFKWYENGWLKSVRQADRFQSYQYDKRGNPIRETFNGTVTERKFSADNLLLEERRPNGLVIQYTYLPGTDLPTSKLEGDGKRIYRRKYWHYDEFHNLVEEIEDDGDIECRVTRYQLRQEPPFLHMPEWIEEPHRKRHLHYDELGNVCQEDVYGKEFAYSTHRTFNERGDVVTETNAIGQTKSYGYDDRGQLIEVSDFGGSLTKRMEYNDWGQLVRLDELTDLYPPCTTTYTYNQRGLLEEKRDHRNYQTIYSYDPIWKKPSRTVGPGQVVTETKYDELGREVKRTDENGQITSTRYNAYDQPTRIAHPDGGVETFGYSDTGELTEHCDPDGLCTLYRRDVFGRITAKLLQNGETADERYKYSGFRLIEKSDREGHKTSYRYDLSGRKIEKNHSGRVTSYTYDNLGFLSTTTQHTLVTHHSHDALGRLLEETQTDLEGTPLHTIAYTYDSRGNRNAITRGDGSVERFTYDPFDRLIEKIDQIGQVTTITYTPDQKVTIRPDGRRTMEAFDPYDRVIEREIDGLSSTKITYTPTGQTCKQVDNGDTTLWTFDPMDRIASETLPAGLTTHFTYTPGGKLKSKTRPTGTQITYTYDGLGYLQEVSSNGPHPCHTFYSRDRLGRILFADHNGTGTSRSYDPFGNVLTETLGNGLTIKRSYDPFDRPLTLTLPDKSEIRYTYDPLYLRSVKRSGMVHTFDAYDLAGHLLSESLINNLGQIHHTTDPKGRRTALASPFFTQTIDAFDLADNPTQITADGKTAFYTYNPLDQLISEPGHTYTVDANHNRAIPNALTYDPDGRLIECDETTYTYDDLDHLIAVNDTHYTYDAFGRKLTKSTGEQYLYDGQTEIGTETQLRVDSIAIELDGVPYAPIYDLQGNIVRLIDPKGGIPASYSYTAFGEQTSPEPALFNPWRFLAKRLDLNLYTFPKRAYSPTLGRWLTPDPLSQCSNPYQYCFHNPLTNIDPDGDFVIAISIVIGAISWQALATSVLVGGVALWAGYEVDQYRERQRQQPYSYEQPHNDLLYPIYGPISFLKKPEKRTVEDLVADSEPRGGRGSTRIYGRPGGYEEALEDFDALNPTNIQNYPNDRVVGYLDDGRTVIARPDSSSRTDAKGPLPLKSKIREAIPKRLSSAMNDEFNLNMIFRPWLPAVKFTQSFYLEFIQCDQSGLHLLFQPVNSVTQALAIDFYIPVTYRVVDEGDLHRPWTKQPPEVRCIINVIENSPYLAWASQSIKSETSELAHYSIDTPIDCLDIISAEEPKIRWIDEEA
jgi:RHS repeat-associated protein